MGGVGCWRAVGLSGEKKMEEDLKDLKATTAGPEEVHRRKRGTD